MKFLNYKNIFLCNYDFYHQFYYLDFCVYKYYKLNKNIFIKRINNKIKNFKCKSSARDKNIPILKKFYNISVYNGKKEFFFKQFNSFIKFFYFIFLKKNNFFINYVDYIDLFNLLEIKKINFDFDFFIKDYINEYNSIFDIKISKVPKKYKLKFKKKFIFELIYIYNDKRLKHTLKLINNYIKGLNNLNIKNNFFWTFIELVLDPKNSFLWKRKMKVYERSVRKFYKKNLN